MRLTKSIFPFPSEGFLDLIAEYVFTDEVSMLARVKEYVFSRTILTKVLLSTKNLYVESFRICQTRGTETKVSRVSDLQKVRTGITK